MVAIASWRTERIWRRSSWAFSSSACFLSRADCTCASFALISAFAEITGVPMVLTTSFNENEPVVNTPEEAVDCFLRTRMDVLAIGPYLVERA